MPVSFAAEHGSIIWSATVGYRAGLARRTDDPATFR